MATVNRTEKAQLRRAGKLLWFHEDAVPGTRHGRVSHGFLADEVHYEGRSEHQSILVFQSPLYGRVLVLDGIVQLSEYDEFVYHEMLVHPALLSHPDPRRVMIIGGGDGGTARECLKHDPEQIVLAEIDPIVVEVARQHLPFTARGVFEDRRLRLVNASGEQEIRKHSSHFDCVIVDGSSTRGPAEALAEGGFHRDVKAALAAGGIAAFQVGSFLDRELLRESYRLLGSLYRFVATLRLTIASYHCGEYCFMLASDRVDLEHVSAEILEERLGRVRDHRALRYYSPFMHLSSRRGPAALALS